MRVVILRTAADGNGDNYWQVPYTGEAEAAAKTMQNAEIAKHGSWADTFYVARIEQVI